MRIPALEVDEFDDNLQSVIADILRLRGQMSHLHRVLANSPKALRAFMSFSEYVRDNADLNPRLRELAILRIATLHHVTYELVHHQVHALQTGLTEEQIANILEWHEHMDLFEARDCAVLAYVEESATIFRVSNATFSLVHQYLNNSEIIDLSLVVGWYLLCAVVIMPLEIELEY